MEHSAQPFIPLIVGTGPTGLMLSVWLHKFGVPHRIVSASPRTGTSSRAIVMHARSIEFYRQLDLADAMLARGTRIEKFLMHTFRKLQLMIPLGDCGKGLSKYPFVLSITQDEQEELLERTIIERGGHIEFGVEVLNVEPDASGDHVNVTLNKNGQHESFTASYVIGCDGAHSVVRRSLGIDMEGGTYDGSFFVSDVHISKSPTIQGQLSVYLADNHFHVVFPLPHTPGRARILGGVPKHIETSRDPSTLTFSDVEPGILHNTDTVSIDQVNWFSRYKVHHRTASTFQIDRVFLCGDAAHIHSPVGGQGMNTGLGDASNLAWKLAAVYHHQGAPPSLLASYSAERVPFAKTLVRTTDRAFTIVTGNSIPSRIVRHFVIPYVMPVLLRVFALGPTIYKTASQIRVAYRDSPLSLDIGGGGWTGSDARAGDRLPWVDDVDGMGNDNHAFLGTAAWQAHVYGRGKAWMETCLTGRGVSVHTFPWRDGMRKVGLRRDAMYLVRPDGYIGVAVAVGKGDEASVMDEVEAYCDRWAVGKRV